MDDILQRLRQHIIDGTPELAGQAAREALSQGIEPLDAINLGCTPGMAQVGEQFGCHQMFLPDVMAASEAMKLAVSVLEPEMRKRGDHRRMLGTIVLGTVQGDIHEIGKSLVAIMLSANGFAVHDLGVSVPTESFVAKAREFNADIVGVSALLTTTMIFQKSVVEALDAAGLRPRIKVVVGGAPINRQWAAEIGADGYAKDAMSAVTLAKALVQNRIEASRAT